MSIYKKHALLSASGSERWLNCPGSIAACADYPSTTSAAAEEGTLAHEMAEFHLVNESNPEETDFEMGEYVQIYLDLVRALPGQAFIEHRVDFSDYAPDGFGTSDYISLDEDSKTLYVADLKYGKGIKVFAENNTQMRLYALGALNAFEHITEIEKISMIICQPRLNWIDEWTISVDELLKWGEWVKQRAELALTDDAPRVPGEKQCQWCQHKAKCPELLELTEATLMAEFDNLVPVNRLTDDELRNVLQHAKLITSWLSAVEEYVKERAESPEGFKGYKLVEGRSVRDWTNAEQAAIALSGSYSEDQLFERSFLSPAKAEKLVGKKNIALIEGLIVKKEGKPTLVPDSDPRPAIGFSVDDF